MMAARTRPASAARRGFLKRSAILTVGFSLVPALEIDAQQASSAPRA